MPPANIHHGAPVARRRRPARTRASCRRLRACLGGTLLALVALALTAARASGQDVGSISGVEPTAEIGRAGAWTPAAAGAAVQIGDVLRTGHPGRMSLVLQDDSVLTIGEGSELVIDDQVFTPDQGMVRTALRLVQGKIRALVSEYYQGRRGGFEVKTPTALAGVRGTDFVVVHTPSIDTTEVVGVTGRVEVNSVMQPERNGVVVTARERTMVARGELPRAPQKLSETLFRSYIEGLQFLVGPQGSLPFAQSIVAGGSVPHQDTVAAAGLPAVPTGAQPLLAPVPGESPYGKGLGTPSAGSVLGQPPSVITSGSSVSIPF
jgi:hypothetical protein